MDNYSNCIDNFSIKCLSQLLIFILPTQLRISCSLVFISFPYTNHIYFSPVLFDIKLLLYIVIK